MSLTPDERETREGGVMLECAGCGKRWAVLPRPDGTMPAGARCPKSRGGCGKVRKVPRSPGAAVTVAAGVAAAAWEPPSQPRGERQTADACPECGGPLTASPRSTLRLCQRCGELRTPPGVLAPYARGGEVTRTAKSQRERDDEAKRMVLAAGEFLRRVGTLLDDPKIHPASADLLRWYDEEITAARRNRNARRLAELADEFADDQAARQFRRAHWWQGEPAALPAARADEGDEVDYDEDPDYGDDDEGQGGEPAAESPAGIAAWQHRAQQPMTWAEALAACGWRIAAAGNGGVHGCQVADEHGQRCRMPNPAHGIQYDATGRHAWLCGEHYGTLGGLINNTNETRGVA